MLTSEGPADPVPEVLTSALGNGKDHAMPLTACNDYCNNTSYTMTVFVEASLETVCIVYETVSVSVCGPESVGMSVTESPTIKDGCAAANESVLCLYNLGYHITEVRLTD